MSTTKPAGRMHRKKKGLNALAVLDSEVRERIEVAAYYLAERREFTPGHELEDWIAAERQVARQLSGSQRG